MSTNPARREPAGSAALDVDPTGQDPDANDPRVNQKLQLQLAIFEVTPDARGKSLDEIQSMLRSAFAARGVESPPGTWLESVASSVFHGEPYIIDFPTAVAADSTLPAPTGDVRRRLSLRRHLRQQKLPAGIFPSPSDWAIPANQTALDSAYDSDDGGNSPAVTRSISPPTVLAAVLVAVAIVRFLGARAARRSLADPDPYKGTGRQSV